MSTRFEEFETNKQKIRRRATSKGLSFGPLATAITVGTVALLLGVTFIGDWLRMPKVAAEASPTIISPNGDKAQDSTNFNYTLNEDAEVTIRVFDESGSLIQTLMSNQFQTRGQHLAVWDGQNNLGQVAPDGRYRLEVTARGTVRSGSQSATVVVDSVPPTLRLANLDELSRVREANLTVEGLTDPDAVVQVEGDPTVIPVDAEGRFTLKQQLLEGSNVIQVTATDPAGNVATVAREVILVTKPPEVVIDNPVNGYWTNENLLNISGVVPAGASLKVNGQEATVNEDGTFEREVILQEGDNIVSVAATDDVGNVSSKDIIIHRKTTPPDLSVNVEEGQIFQQEEVQIIGKTNPGATVLVGGQKVDVSSLGEFQATVRLLQGDNLLGVVTQDQAGNTTRLQRRLRFNIPATHPGLYPDPAGGAGHFSREQCFPARAAGRRPVSPSVP
jgi:flagellar hook assembly protein FlgD